MRKTFACGTILATLALAGCGDEVKCSSQSTIDTLYNIMLQQIGLAGEGANMTPELINAQKQYKARWKFSDFVTRQQSSNAASCKANLTLIERDHTTVVTCDVEKTDDGRISVTARGL